MRVRPTRSYSSQSRPDKPEDKRSARRGLAKPDVDELLHQMPREWLVDVKAKCSRGGRVTFQFFAELDEHRPAVRQVAEMVLKRGEACDRLAADLERRGAIGDALVSVGQDVQDRFTQLGQGAALRLIQRLQ